MKIMEKLNKRKTLTEFGFGTEVMKEFTVCINCNSLENSKNLYCSKCNSKLPNVNLYDFYRVQHRECSKCGTLLSHSMNYCPKCGVKVK